MTASDYLVIATPTTANINITLPVPARKEGRIIRVLNGDTGASARTVNMIGGTIKSLTPIALTSMQAVELVYDSANGTWFVLSRAN